MPLIPNVEYQIKRFISDAPAAGVLAALDGAGAVVNLLAWDPVTGDVTHSAPAGTGANTRIHRYDRPIVSTSTITSGVVNVSAPTGELHITSTTVNNPGYLRITTTGGDYFFGVEGLGGTFGGSTYAGIIYAPGARAIEFFPGATKTVVMIAGSMTAAIDNGVALGSASFRWSDVRAMIGNFSGDVTITGTNAYYRIVGGASSSDIGLSLRSTLYSASGGMDLRQRAGNGWGIDFTSGFEIRGHAATIASVALLLAISAAGAITPGADNAQSFGSASVRWSAIHAMAVTIYNTLVAAGGIQITGDAFSITAGSVIKRSSEGFTIVGIAGSVSNFTLLTPAGSAVISNPIGTTNLLLNGSVDMNAGFYLRMSATGKVGIGLDNLDFPALSIGHIGIQQNTYFVAGRGGGSLARLIGYDSSAANILIDVDGYGSRFNGPVYPNGDNSKDFGTGSLRWRDGFFGRNVTVDGTLVAGAQALFKATDSQMRSNRVIVSCPNGVDTTILDISVFAGVNGDTLLVWAQDGNAGRVASCEVTKDSGTPTWRIFTKEQGVAPWTGTFTMSGSNLRFRQSTGGTTSPTFIFLKIPGN